MIGAYEANREIKTRFGTLRYTLRYIIMIVTIIIIIIRWQHLEVAISLPVLLLVMNILAKTILNHSFKVINHHMKYYPIDELRTMLLPCAIQ